MEETIIEIDEKELRKIQLLQLEILREADRICRKYAIRYTLCGGSLLGAVRHKGFIPWDDDIDISMLREDYDRFLEVCKTELDSSKYFVQTVDTDPEYRWLYGKIVLNGTVYQRAGQESIKSHNGIFIDIFPRDSKSGVYIAGWIQSKCAYLLRKIMWSPVGAEKSKSRFNRWIFRLLSKIKKKKALKLLEFINFLNFGKETKKVRCWGLMGNGEKKKYLVGKKEYKKYVQTYVHSLDKEERKRRNEGILRIFFLETMDAKFEDLTVRITSHYDEWLRFTFDDYMKLPPEDKRVMHQKASAYSLGEYNAAAEELYERDQRRKNGFI